ncbi:hypothetical protein NHX12_008875 [Muraenolepis orangiensis]|uniref:Uncharacterized protein n=1 Tax=Muraenolepis orangiensis TaxID=630683 RepID=A0A9Q0DQR4_9TELE|nr:hypothetical protein NHX12_008875 [Muraenolepis orangiensis]
MDLLTPIVVLVVQQMVWGEDSVALLNPPEEPVSGHRLKVLYSCDGRALVSVDCLVTFDTGANSTIPLGRWSCEPGEPARVRAVELCFPDWLVYRRADGVAAPWESRWVQSSVLLASLRRAGRWEAERWGGEVVVQDLAELRSVPPLRRPLKQYNLSFSWSSLMMRLTWNYSRSHCAEEQETVSLLSSVYASSGEVYGVTKTLGVFSSEVLESSRLRSVSYPWCMFSIWVFVMKGCEDRLCSVFHHINSNDSYVTPVIFLTRTGQLQFQMSGEPGKSTAFVSAFRVPLRQWCHLSVVLRGRTATVDVSGCLGDDHSLHMAAVLYSTGLGAWLLALLGAQRDSRLSLLHMGHGHHQGDQGLPADPDLAYAYYANIAKQTSLDRLRPSPGQTFVEAIYLNNEEALQQQTSENHHIFQWLKLQAHQGAANQRMGRMLFWGQQGVSADVQKAARHYERGAVRLQDPVSMYDFAIVLMQGLGVKKDVPRAVAFLKKAKHQGHVPATSALAWYYEQFERDYKRAVELWEEADLLGSPDAAMNLGVMHSQGKYPGKPVDQFMAYKCYLKSAQRGHVTGAVLLSGMLTRGIPGRLPRRPADAALWSKWASEHNGYLGSVLRKALNSHLNNQRLMSLFYYLMAAESGYAAAQFNAAHICEENSEGFLDPLFAAHCLKRYYNLTVHSQHPNTAALIKMGDLFYEGHVAGHIDIASAAQKYKRAALMKDPQGWYSLGQLIEQDYRLPLSVMIDLGLPELYLADKHTLQVAICRDSGTKEAYLPCCLALFNVHLQSFQRDYSAFITLSSLAVVVITVPPILLVLVAYLRGSGLSPH